MKGTIEKLMKKKMLINAMESEEYRIAIINDGHLDDFHIDMTTSEQKEGNIYKGVVERIERNLQSCFVNYGGNRNGFLSIDDIHPEYYHETGAAKKEKAYPPIEKAIKKGQEILVEVTKEMPGKKGCSVNDIPFFSRTVSCYHSWKDNQRNIQKNRR